MAVSQISGRKIKEILQNGGVGVMPTDTIYGLIGSALIPKTVEKIYQLRKRNSKKPFIILIGRLADLNKFKLKLGTVQKKFLKKHWPGKISVILPSENKNFAYLRKGQKTLAFRMPAKKTLRDLIGKTGPLVAPSANFEGKPEARTVRAAKKYFGKNIDFYLDGGKLFSKPSTLVDICRKTPVILRAGAVDTKKLYN